MGRRYNTLQNLQKHKGKIYCSKCKRWKDKKYFARNRAKRLKHSSRCKGCVNSITILTGSSSKNYRKKAILKLGGKCISCGCDVLDILEINHIDGGGREEYRRVSPTKIYKLIIDTDLSSRYNVLCKICNILHFVETKKGVRGFQISYTSK